MYMVKSITIDGSDIKRGVEAVDENNTLLSTLTNTKQRVVFIYGSAENLYLGSVKGFFSSDFQDPATLESKNRSVSSAHYSLLVVAYGPDVDISYKELVTDLYLELDSDTHSGKYRKSKRVILSRDTDFSVMANPNLIRKNKNWQKVADRDNKDLPTNYPEILRDIWHALFRNGHGYVSRSTSTGVDNALLQKYSPSVSLDLRQRGVIDDICFKHANADHVIFGGAGTGKTLLMIQAADRLSKVCKKSTYLVTQGNCATEFKQLVRETGNGDVRLDSLVGFTAKIADDLLYGLLPKPFVDTVFVDEAHNLPSFRKGQYGKTSFGFRQDAWGYSPKENLKKGKPKKAKNLRQLFNAPPTGPEDEQQGAIKDYMDFLIFLKNHGYINQIVICYDGDQWVYSGSVARTDPFQVSEGSGIATYHGHEFCEHRLYAQYRILSESGESDKGTDFVTGIRTFLQLEPSTRTFNRSVFQDCEFGGEQIWKENPNPSYFGIVNSIKELFDYINIMHEKHPGSHNRVVAGYARYWDKTHIDPSLNYEDRLARKVWFDDAPSDKGGKNQGWAWNNKKEGFVFDEALEEVHRAQVGSIFSVQGIDLNYVGVIIAEDIKYDKATHTIVGVPKNYKHRMGIVPMELRRTDPSRFKQDFNKQIRGSYYTLMTRGINGVRFYFMDEDMKQYFLEFMGIRPPAAVCY